MAAAEVGDEQRFEDPTTLRLQERVAELLGHEAALFLPSGTMCNVIASGCTPARGGRGDPRRQLPPRELRGGGPAVLAQAMTRQLDAPRRRLLAEQVERRSARRATATASLAPGVGREHDQPWRRPRVADRDRPRVLEVARKRGSAGAPRRRAPDERGGRLGHPGVRSTPRASTPPGSTSRRGSARRSAQCSRARRELIEEAWRHKQMMGGALRQSGVLAAACLHALDHHCERLAEDHENARLLADGLAELRGAVDPARSRRTS